MGISTEVKYTENSYHHFFGIFIGIEKFIHSQGNIKSLYHANEDALQLCEFFRNAYKGTNHRTDLSVFIDRPLLQKKKFSSSRHIHEGTRANILHKLTEVLKAARPDDFILLFISTHGEIDYNDYFFVPGDGNLDNILGTGISSSTLIQALSKASAMDVRVLLVIDTCFSGAIGFDISKYKGSFSCLLSSSPVEFSYEFYDKEHGIFTHFLLEGLGGKAMINHSITLGSLFDYVYDNVQAVTRKRQNPLLIGTLPYSFTLFENAGEQKSTDSNIVYAGR